MNKKGMYENNYPPHSVNILDYDKRERPNKTPKERDSSVETFRILATFTVLIVHFTGWFLGGDARTVYS